MTQYLVLILGLCSATVLAEEAAVWPPQDLEGAWRVVSVSEDNPTDNVELAETESLILVKDYPILTETKPLSAYGNRLSDGVAHAAGYRANLNIPSTVFDLNGGRNDGIAKEPIAFSIGKGPQTILDVTMDLYGTGLRIRAERIGRRDAFKKINTLLADPTFDCSVKIRGLLKSYEENVPQSP